MRIENYFAQTLKIEIVLSFNKYRLHGRKLLVFKSDNHRLLMIGNLDQNVSDEDVQDYIRVQTDANFVYIYKFENFKYCLIRYPSHQSAVSAHRILISKMHQFGSRVYIRWLKE